jgi:hypothetical protein
MEDNGKDIGKDNEKDNGKDNIFSQPWNDSDVVLVVEGNEFHVHRSILSLQSPVFKAMFNGNFKDATEKKIELKDDKYEAMLLFLQLLYPPNMLDENKSNVDINDENIFQIIQVAHKYTAINVIKQCMRETGRLKPENTMRLLPYAARHELPLENIFKVIARRISMDELETFSSQLGDDSVYIKTLVTKCRVQENVAKRAHTMMLHLLKKYVAAEMAKDINKTSVSCVRHKSLNVENFKEARKCENCLEAYKKRFIDKYVYANTSRYGEKMSSQSSSEFIELLELTDDIATSLQS